VLAISASALTQDFHRLSGAQIQSTVVGKRITDDTHWSRLVEAGGRLLVRDMGRTSTGTWQIRNDRLCIVRPRIVDDCYEVWLAGEAIQLRSQGAMPLTVFLRPATTR
jgi:hypothetical protein